MVALSNLTASRSRGSDALLLLFILVVITTWLAVATDFWMFHPGPDWLTTTSPLTWSEAIPRPTPEWLAPFRWLGLIALFGFVNLPLTLFVCRRLPDHGWMLSRPLGLILISATAWLLMSLGPSDSRDAWFLGFLLVALVNAAILITNGRYRVFASLVRKSWRVFHVEEMFFIVAFGLFLWVRAMSPEVMTATPLLSGEKPHDLSLLAAVMKSPEMPPLDPWFAGEYVTHYYYYGHFIVGSLCRIVGVVPEVGWNLAIPMFFALTTAVAFSVGYNLVGMTRRSSRARMLGGAASALLCAGITGGTNWVELLFSAGPDPSAIGEAYHSSKFMMVGGYYLETPAAVHLLGEIHGHLMSMPFVLTALALSLAMLRPTWGRGRLSRSLHEVALLTLLGITLGTVLVVNGWDFPALAIMLGGAVAIGQARNLPPRWPGRAIWACGVAGRVTVVLLVAFVAFAPYHILSSVSPSIDLGSPANVSLLSILFYYLVFMVAVLVPMYLTVFRDATHRTRQMILMAFPIFLLVVLVCSLVAATLSLILGALVVAALMGFWYRRETEVSNVVRLYVIMAMSVFFMVVVGVNVVSVHEPDIFGLGVPGSNVNGILKFYSIMWLLLGVSSGWAIGYYYDKHRWYIRVVCILVGISVLYTAVVYQSRIDMGLSDGPLTLDGFAPLLHNETFPQPSALQFYSLLPHEPSFGFDEVHRDALISRNNDRPVPMRDELATVQWLRENAKGDATLLESNAINSHVWPSGGRFSTATGIPTIIGSELHQSLYRGPERWPEIQKRVSEVREVFDPDGDPSRALEIIDRYGVDYVTVGYTERLFFGGDRVADKFHTTLSDQFKNVFQSGDVSVYQRRASHP